MERRERTEWRRQFKTNGIKNLKKQLENQECVGYVGMLGLGEENFLRLVSSEIDGIPVKFHIEDIVDGFEGYIRFNLDSQSEKHIDKFFQAMNQLQKEGIPILDVSLAHGWSFGLEYFNKKKKENSHLCLLPPVQKN